MSSIFGTALVVFAFVSIGNTQAINPNPKTSNDDNCTCIPYYLCSEVKPINVDAAHLIDVRRITCDNYLHVCCEPSKIIREDSTNSKTRRSVTSAPSAARKETKCGYTYPVGIDFHVPNSYALFGEVPWMVAILAEDIQNKQIKSPSYQCGGALIHPSVVLTTTHCVHDKNLRLRIRAGEWDAQTTEEPQPHQERNVKQVIIHKHFKTSLEFSIPSHDVALLVLEEPVKLESHINVICLPPKGLVSKDTRCMVSGWGRDFGKDGKNSVILQTVQMPIVEQALCQQQLRNTSLGEHFSLDDEFICSGNSDGSDTCIPDGDSGSPYVCLVPGETDRYMQMGMVDWRIGCARENVPSVKVNVAKYRDWIDEQMKSLGYDVSIYSF